jgi:diadenylate cyclase
MQELYTEVLFFLDRINLTSVLDLLLVTAIFFIAISILRGTQAEILLRGMILLIIVMALLASLLPLPGFSWLITTTLPALIFAIPVIFAPEIRRAFERLGRAGNLFSGSSKPSAIEQRVDTIVHAANRLSQKRHGALMVIEREVPLHDYQETGVALDSILSTDLLIQIFYSNTPLHDGAVIIREDRIAAASCVMPLSSSGTLLRTPERQMGLRHRAAIGITEVSDAVAVVVSEETGNISVAHNGRMIRRLDQSRLRNILHAFYRPQVRRVLPDWLNRLTTRLSRPEAEAPGD